MIWNGHPLSMHTRAEQTWIDGALYWDMDSDSVAREAASAERRALVQKLLAEEEETAAEEAGDDEGGDGEPDSDAPVAPERHRYDCEDLEDYWHARTP